jgi:mannose-6-phosphate isomerase-like protein (cupin superfamily)
MRVEKVSLSQKLALFSDQWKPKIVADVNDHLVKLVKVQGDFVWHKHDTEDEMFLCVGGRLTIHFRDGDVVLDPGEFVVVPRGVEHKPSAREEAQVVLFEPRTTLNTGDAKSDRTVAVLDRI